MRLGMNPLRELSIDRQLPPAVPVVVVVTHLPETESDYHKERWDIVTASLTLARQNAGMEHWLVVWDNGSCEEFRQWLYQFAPEQLILSDNIGVLNTMKRVMGMYHDSIVAWCNDDILYYPDWLPEQVHILQSFPNVATVSGCVTKYYTNKADEKTKEWAQDNASVEYIKTPLEWDVLHGLSIGKSEQHTRDVYTHAAVHLVEYNGVNAIIGGNHCQMVCKAATLYPFLMNTERYMQPLFTTLDIPINDACLLRLLTTTRRTRHIGNVMTEYDRKEINELVDSLKT